MKYKVVPDELAHQLSCVVESGHVTLKPSQMYYVARMHGLGFFKDGDTVTLNRKGKSVVCNCRDYPFYWRWFFSLRVLWYRLILKSA